MPQFCVAICSPDSRYLPAGTWRKIWKYPVFRSSAPMNNCFPRVTSKVESDRELSFRHHCRVNSDTVEDHAQPREDLAVFPGVPRYYPDAKLFRGDMAGDLSESTSRRSISFPSERGRSCWLNMVEDHVCAPFMTTTRWGLIASETHAGPYPPTRRVAEGDRPKSRTVREPHQVWESRRGGWWDLAEGGGTEGRGNQLAKRVWSGPGGGVVRVRETEEAKEVLAGVNWWRKRGVRLLRHRTNIPSALP